MEIVKAVGREILDSRGNPTVEADVHLADKTIGRAAVPSGASTGEHEAVELRDGDKSRYLGKGTQKAAENITKQISPALSGIDAADQMKVDRTMLTLDGSPNKEQTRRECNPGGLDGGRARAAGIGNDSALPISRRCERRVLPVPMMNIINGGAHADNSVDLQEFMIAPDRRDRSFPKRCAWAPRFSTRSRASEEARLFDRGGR
jgi:enolase